MQTINIREAQIKDKLILCDLMRQLGYPISESDMQNRIELYTRHPVNKAFVAELEKKIIGSLALNIIDLFHTKDRFARVISMVIDEKFRNKGVGKKLMAYAEKYSKSINCTRIELTTDWSREKDGTHHFYKNLDYSELRLYLAKEI